jgi:hypothetical protein
MSQQNNTHTNNIKSAYDLASVIESCPLGCDCWSNECQYLHKQLDGSTCVWYKDGKECGYMFCISGGHEPRYSGKFPCHNKNCKYPDCKFFHAHVPKLSSCRTGIGRTGIGRTSIGRTSIGKTSNPVIIPIASVSVSATTPVTVSATVPDDTQNNNSSGIDFDIVSAYVQKMKNEIDDLKSKNTNLILENTDMKSENAILKSKIAEHKKESEIKKLKEQESAKKLMALMK